MIAHLRGKLIYKQPGQVIVEAAGVGYDVTISVPTFTALPSVGAEAALHIHTQVSEDQIAIKGEWCSLGGWGIYNEHHDRSLARKAYPQTARPGHRRSRRFLRR